MSTIWLAAMCGLGCLRAAGSAVLLTGRRRVSVAFGGALAFMALLLVLVCAGVTVASLAAPGGRRSPGAEQIIEQMIERELR